MKHHREIFHQILSDFVTRYSQLDSTLEMYLLDCDWLELRKAANQYHIVWHDSYQLPCLYLLCQDFDKDSLGRRSHFKLSLVEHPRLFCPCWMVHPCDMLQVFQQVSWESWIGWLSFHSLPCLDTDLLAQIYHQQ